jgi:hypothetical protein
MGLMLAQMKVGFVILGLTLLSGYADSRGFFHAAKIWQGQHVLWLEVAKSGLGFGCGILLYWVVLKYLNEVRIATPEIQTLIWFGVTIVGVALLSGKFVQWRSIDQGVAVAVLLGIGWLFVRVRG